MGVLGEDHFIVEALDEGRKCLTTSVAAHTLYEKDHPFMLQGPGIELDLSQSIFEQHTDSTVRVSGSRIKVPDTYTIKLEGSGWRTLHVAWVEMAGQRGDAQFP